MNDIEIHKLYGELKDHWEKNLKKHDVKLPNLFHSERYTLNALALVYFYRNMGNIVSKNDLTSFFRLMGFNPNDVQQGRHLANTSGWYIVSRTRGDLEAINRNLSNGDYMLISVTEPYPSYKSKKRIVDISDTSWEEIKNKYNYQCASCGSIEGEPNRFYPSTITELQKGHMDPSKLLNPGNIIPQCSKCNRPDRNYFIYDEFGRVVSIADPKYIFKSSQKVQKETLRFLINRYPEESINILKEIRDNTND